jgi:hypothetical protein
LARYLANFVEYHQTVIEWVWGKQHQQHGF